MLLPAAEPDAALGQPGGGLDLSNHADALTSSATGPRARRHAPEPWEGRIVLVPIPEAISETCPAKRLLYLG
jgi:hypothetical protein